ncbi:MAG TPA: secondary thiamine-phosphate synthase enzyme YjbQ [Pyrinomonadaceae bacterium]|nr:secondary thiamine-phosphate synthase enzyme YjbQ [Pyrinomonadaceae bacterium]
METIRVRSTEREQLVEITGDVRRKLEAAGARSGVCVLFVRHTTAALTVNENADPDVPSDMLMHLGKLVPQHGQNFRHAEQNSDAHIKATLVGPDLALPFHDGRLLLGRWQGVFLCEFDGPREREVVMQVMRSD